MITIFNGRRRGLAEMPEHQVYIQISVMFRNYLHRLKGAKLAVFMAIALHANEDGWAWPSYETLKRETGYSADKIRDALNELCVLEIDGHRILLRYQPQVHRGQFGTNLYLIFPTQEEVERYEKSGVSHQPGDGFRKRRCGKTPLRQNTTTDRCGETPQQTITNIELEPDQEEEEEEEQREKTEKPYGIAQANEIAQALCENGVFPENAMRIGAMMVEAGMTAKDALEIYLATLRSVTQHNIPDEQSIALAVYRLEQGIWDAGERAREALRRARYASHDYSDSAERTQEIAKSTGEENPLWQTVLGELQLELTRATFETWLRNSRLIACENGVFVIGVANTYARDWLESRLRAVVERVLTRVVGQTASVRFVVVD